MQGMGARVHVCPWENIMVVVEHILLWSNQAVYNTASYEKLTGWLHFKG